MLIRPQNRRLDFRRSRYVCPISSQFQHLILSEERITHTSSGDVITHFPRCLQSLPRKGIRSGPGGPEKFLMPMTLFP